MANLEAELVFTALARRFPRLAAWEVERRESMLARGLARLVLDCR